MDDNKQPKTYAELLEVLKAMTPEQLAKPIQAMGEETADFVSDFWILEEDYVSVEGEFCEPKSVYEGDPDYANTEMKVVASKGDLVLLTYETYSLQKLFRCF